jgi:hypothetical protein
LCVGGNGCYRTIRAAVNGAHAGHTITIRAGAFAAGGIEIPPGAHLVVDATVTITDSVIAGNRVNLSASVPSRIPCPGARNPTGTHDLAGPVAHPPACSPA